MHRTQELAVVTEDDVNEIKGDISSLRFELLDVYKRNGICTCLTNKNTQGAV